MTSGLRCCCCPGKELARKGLPPALARDPPSTCKCGGKDPRMLCLPLPAPAPPPSDESLGNPPPPSGAETVRRRLALLLASESSPASARPADRLDALDSTSGSTSPSASTSSTSSSTSPSSSEEEEYHRSALTLSLCRFLPLSPSLSFSFSLRFSTDFFFILLGKLAIRGLETGVGALLLEREGEGDRSPALVWPGSSETPLSSLRFFLAAAAVAVASEMGSSRAGGGEGRLIVEMEEEEEEGGKATLFRLLLELEVLVAVVAAGNPSRSFFFGLGEPLLPPLPCATPALAPARFSFFKLSLPFMTPPPPALIPAPPIELEPGNSTCAVLVGLPAELRDVRPVEEDWMTEDELEVLESAGEAEDVGEVALTGAGGGGGGRLAAEVVVGTAAGGGGGKGGLTDVDRCGLVLLLPPLLRLAGTVPLPIRKLDVGCLTA